MELLNEGDLIEPNELEERGDEAAVDMDIWRTALFRPTLAPALLGLKLRLITGVSFVDEHEDDDEDLAELGDDDEEVCVEQVLARLDKVD